MASDRAGQVSFSVIAVAILVTSISAGVVYAKRQLDEIGDDRQRELLCAMGEEADAVANELTLCGISRAHSTISAWSEFPINESRISESFSASMADYISKSFPRIRERWTLSVLNWTGGLFFVEMSTEDIVPSDATRRATFECEGSSMEYDRLDDSSNDAVGRSTANPYYVAVGNFTVTVQKKDVSLHKAATFQRPIVSALPFVESKLRAFESASSGEASDMESLVGYMLTTLAQIRVLEGYGQPMYVCDRNTSSILTEEDVYRAVAVALLLEQVRLLRDFDDSYGERVASICGGEYGLMALSGARGRYLDPAELFLWFLGKTRLEIDARTIVAQAVFGLSDQLVLRLMEYSGWLGALDLLNDAVELTEYSVDAILSFLTGEDRAKSSVVEWLERSLRVAGHEPKDLTVVFTQEADCSVAVPERVYYVEDAYGSQYPVWVGNISVLVDVPAADLLVSDEWSSFYPTYKVHQGSFRQLAEDGLLRFAFDIASCAEFQTEEVYVDPADGRTIFDILAGRADALAISFDPVRVREAARSLPMYSAQYDLAVALSEFVSSKCEGLVDADALLDGALDAVVDMVLGSTRHPYIPDLVVPVDQQLREIVRADLESDIQWNVGPALRTSLTTILSLCLSRLAEGVGESVSKADDDFAGPLVDFVSSVLVSGIEGLPGLEQLVIESVRATSKEILSQSSFSSHKRSIYLDTGGRFEFWDGELETARSADAVLQERTSVELIGGLPELRTVPYSPSQGYTSLDRMLPADELLVQVRRPWDFARSEPEYPNTHLTSIDNISLTPYTTRWTASVAGVVELRATSENSEMQGAICGPAASSRNVRLELSIPVVVHSPWPLHGVEYNPSNTLLSDGIAAAKKFVELIWDKLEPVVGWLKDGFMRMIKLLSNIFDVVASFATKVVRAAASAMQTLVETLQAYVERIANSALARALKLFLDMTGRVSATFSVHGFVITIQTYLPDLIHRHGSDMLRVIVFTDRFGPGLTFGMRVARLMDGSYDILANATIALRSAVIEVAVDPFMHILRRFLEAHCTAQSWRLDVVMPEVEPYDIAEASTARIPGLGALLSNIPIPVLGLSASIEFGMRLKYSNPFPTDVVINEVEANPKGDDSGKEWVELYNPLSEPRSLAGWTLGTAHGKSSALALEGVIAPNGVRVFTFPETSIDNGNTDDPFNDGDAVTLSNQAGVVVDSTPVLIDTANDGRTNQRKWDGGPKWMFKESTMGQSNGLALVSATSDFIAKALFEAFREAFAETKLEEVTASLEFVILLSKRVLYHFIENLLAVVKEIIHEVIFYIKVGLSDASGSVGGAFRASFVVTGEAIVDLLRWLIHSLATFIVNLGRASCPQAYPPFPSEFFAGLYLRFEALFEVGLPKMIRVLGAAGDIDGRFACAACISPNLPALGKLVGRHWGNWSVDLGVYLEGVPREFASTVLSMDSSDFVDFWLVRARVHGV